MPASEKHHAIEYIFDRHWDANAGRLKDPIVTKADVKEAIVWSNAKKGTNLSDDNPANFMKDIVRGQGGNRMWPQRLRDLGITADQEMGDGAVFRFIPYAAGQSEPFPDAFTYRPGKTPTLEIQSLSVPAVTKALGRNDENYLIQVAVKLAVVETHFALLSPLKGRVSEIHHLQVGLKLRKTEIDTMFLATLVDDDGEPVPVLITAEAKKGGQRIVESQIVRQVKGAFPALPTMNRVLPIAMTSVAQGIYVAEFQQVSREEVATFDELELLAEGFYKLVPPVNGIGYRAPRKPRKAALAKPTN